jgi:hypothetical protein
MTTTVVVLLGIMALASLTQALFLIVLAVEGRRLAQRVDTFQARIGGELRPILGEMTRATDNLAAASAATLGQARRIDVMMTEVTGRLSDTEGLCCASASRSNASNRATRNRTAATNACT